jgi:GTPase SAR1 family protein
MKKSKGLNAPQNPIRIVVLGDAGTGKSSLINVFISANFEEDIAPLIPVAVCTQFFLTFLIWSS